MRTSVVAVLASVLAYLISRSIQPLVGTSPAVRSVAAELCSVSLFWLWGAALIALEGVVVALHVLLARVVPVPKLSAAVHSILSGLLIGYLATQAVLAGTKVESYFAAAWMAMSGVSAVGVYLWFYRRPDATELGRWRLARVAGAATCVAASVVLLWLNAAHYIHAYHAIHVLGVLVAIALLQAALLWTAPPTFRAMPAIASVGISAAALWTLLIADIGVGTYGQVLAQPLVYSQYVVASRHLSNIGGDDLLLSLSGDDVYGKYRGPTDPDARGMSASDAAREKRRALFLQPPRPQDSPAQRCSGPEVRHVVWISLDAFRFELTQRPDFATLAPNVHQLIRSSHFFSGFHTASARTYLSIIAELKGDFDVVDFSDASSFALATLKQHGYFVHLAGLFLAPEAFFDAVDGFFWMHPPWDSGHRKQYPQPADYFPRLSHHLEQAKSGGPLFSFVHLGELHAPHNYSNASTRYQQYLDTVRVVDGHVGRILELIDAHGLSESTIVVFNADHGEEFQEHGGWRHATTLYEEAVHVPLVIRVPGAGRGRTDNVVSAFDIMPTLFDALGIQKPANIFGQSLYPALCGQPIAHDLAVGHTYNPTPLFVPKDQVVVHKTYLLRSNEKIILDHPTGSVELYDLRTDPRETTNLYGQDVLRDQEHARALDLLLASIDEPEVFTLIPLRPRIRKPLVDLYEGWHR